LQVIEAIEGNDGLVCAATYSATERSHDDCEFDPGYSLLAATVTEDPGIHGDGGADAGTGHRGKLRDFYAGACGAAQEPARG